MYIRTKDGVYLVDEERETYFIKLSKNGFENYVPRENVIAQSENLEELCDCFVIEWLPTNHKDIFKVDKYSKEVVKSCIGNNKTKVYGAIWCEFGLKYVAKLNSKGELELI